MQNKLYSQRLKQATEYDVAVAVFKNYTAEAKW